MKESTLRALLDAASGVRASVVGDFGVDRYLYLDPGIEDCSVETGQPIRQVVRATSAPGGAGTIASNLLALGAAEVRVVGVVGDDPEGVWVRRALAEAGADTAGLVEAPGRMTPAWTRPMEPGVGAWVESRRLDSFPRYPLTSDVADTMADAVAAAVEASDVVILSDYGELGKAGLLDGRSGTRLARRAARSPILLSSSRLRPAQLGGAPVLNDAELDLAEPGSDDVGTRAAALAERLGASVFVTVGAAGALCCDADGTHALPAHPVFGRCDPIGAGDALLAALALGLAAGGSGVEALALGVLASSIVVEALETTGVATPDAVAARIAPYLQRIVDADHSEAA